MSNRSLDQKIRFSQMQSITATIRKPKRWIMSHVTSRDIAKKAGVSTTTISRTLNNKPVCEELFDKRKKYFFIKKLDLPN
ncbi:MAG: LacI family DNA-binding transcriptional regulator [bacterium]